MDTNTNIDKKWKITRFVPKGCENILVRNVEGFSSIEELTELWFVKCWLTGDHVRLALIGNEIRLVMLGGLLVESGITIGTVEGNLEELSLLFAPYVAEAELKYKYGLEHYRDEVCNGSGTVAEDHTEQIPSPKVDAKTASSVTLAAIEVAEGFVKDAKNCIADGKNDVEGCRLNASKAIGALERMVAELNVAYFN